MLTVRCGLMAEISTVTILVDNTEIMFRIQDRLPSISIRYHLAPEYDLWAEEIHLSSALPFSIKMQWVKAHQDDVKISNLIAYG